MMKRAASIVTILVLLGLLVYWIRSAGPVEPTASSSGAGSQAAVPVATVATAAMERADEAEVDAPSTRIRDAANMERAAALDQALAEKDPVNRSMAFGRTLRAWFASEPEAALAYLRTMPSGNEYVSGLLIVLGGIGSNNMPRALGLAAEMATNSEQRVVYNVLFDQLARVNLLQAATLLGLVPEGEARDNALRALGSRWVDQDMDAALTWAQGLEDEAARTPAMEAVLFTMVRKEPWRALLLAGQSLDGDALERSVNRFLKEVAVTDPARASEVVKMIPAGETQAHAILNLSRVLASQDPAAAMDWLAGLPADEVQQQGLVNIVDLWSRQDAEKALDFVAAGLTGPAQVAAAGKLAQNLAVKDPAAALAWSAMLPQPEARSAALVQATSAWARKDPGAATAWAAAMPEQDVAKTDALAGALSHWVLADPPAAAAYVRKLPAGAGRDHVLESAGRQLAGPNPALALDLASGIQDPVKRESAQVQLARDWLQADPAAARTWIRSSQLPAEMVRRLIPE